MSQKYLLKMTFALLSPSCKTLIFVLHEFIKISISVTEKRGVRAAILKYMPPERTTDFRSLFGDLYNQPIMLLHLKCIDAQIDRKRYPKMQVVAKRSKKLYVTSICKGTQSYSQVCKYKQLLRSALCYEPLDPSSI